ncbi:DUF1990 family protein [Streptacidiphilus cavernicola]|uniref:DUF1990 family protein n=1 Tax=Streptacidiphilus cavernicola TaxID=3342716 RepID=A0ABV6W3C4_9ACTN
MSGFSYPETGATRADGPLPEGYAHLYYRTRLGQGPAVFAAAGDAVLSWRMHRAVGVRPAADADRAAPGVRVRVLLGVGRLALSAPCEVVWAVDGEVEAGFGYGTLAGHPECGEEGFLVQREGDAVWFTVTAFSRPARWYTRAGGPLVPLFQQLYARRCGRVLRRLARA